MQGRLYIFIVRPRYHLTLNKLLLAYYFSSSIKDLRCDGRSRWTLQAEAFVFTFPKEYFLLSWYDSLATTGYFECHSWFCTASLFTKFRKTEFSKSTHTIAFFCEMSISWRWCLGIIVVLETPLYKYLAQVSLVRYPLHLSWSRHILCGYWYQS